MNHNTIIYILIILINKFNNNLTTMIKKDTHVTDFLQVRCQQTIVIILSWQLIRFNLICDQLIAVISSLKLSNLKEVDSLVVKR